MRNRFVLTVLAAVVPLAAVLGCGPGSTSAPAQKSTSSHASRGFEAKVVRWTEKAGGGEGAIELADLSTRMEPGTSARAERTARRILRRADLQEQAAKLRYVGTGVLTADLSPPVDQEHINVVVFRWPATAKLPAKYMVMFLNASARRLILQFSYAPGTVSTFG